MLKFVLFAMIGHKLDMDNWYWVVLNAYAFCWFVGKIMEWL